MNSGSRTANESRVRNRLWANGGRAIRRRCCLRGYEGGERREGPAREAACVNEHSRPQTSTSERTARLRSTRNWLKNQRQVFLTCSDDVEIKAMCPHQLRGLAMRLFRHIRALPQPRRRGRASSETSESALPLTIARLLQEQRGLRRTGRGRRTEQRCRCRRAPSSRRPVHPPARPLARFCLVGNRHPDARRCGPRRRRRRPLHF